MAQALKEATDQLDANYQYIQSLSDRILTGLEDLDFYLNGTDSKLPHVLNIGFPGISNDIPLLRLDMAGISVSTGSACTAGDCSAKSCPCSVLRRRFSSLEGIYSH